MSLKLTCEQELAINIRDKEVMVSAGAGAGKTSVLVERVMGLITDCRANVSMDNILMVTFTEEATKSMKDKIYKALNNKLADDPTNEKLTKEIFLLQRANISTIHGFCRDVIQKNINLLDIDPKFRVGSKEEVELIKSEVFDDVIEKFYTMAETDKNNFYKLVNSFVTKVTDDKFKEMFFSLYSKAYNNPDAYKWLDESVESFNHRDFESIINSQDFILFKNHLIDLVKKKELLESRYNDDFKDVDQEKVKEVYSYFKSNIDYQNFYEKFDQVNAENFKDFKNDVKFILDIPSIKSRKHKLDEDLKDVYNAFKKERDSLKKDVERELPESHFLFLDIDEMVYVYKEIYEAMVEFKMFFVAFDKAFKDVKTANRLIDFNDMEQFTLQLLYHEVEGEKIREFYRNKFYEVIVDEYQDCNDTQEAIFKAITNGGENMYMVGDVKQSIYKFRGAKPEIFLSKLVTQKDNREIIKLNKNFRSGQLILDFVNNIFKVIMEEKSGEIDYGNGHVLIHDEVSKAGLGNSEILVTTGVEPLEDKYIENLLDIYKAKDELTEEDVKEALKVKSKEETEGSTKTKSKKKEAEVEVDHLNIYREINYGLEKGLYESMEKAIKSLSLPKSELEQEAEVIANRILEFKNNGEADFKDIAILLRSANSANTISAVLEKYNIPYKANKNENVFNSFEIQSVTNYLKIIDNKYQNIPLVFVLKLPIYNFLESELLFIKKEYNKKYFFSGILAYLKEKADITVIDVINGLAEDRVKANSDELLEKVYLFIKDYYHLKNLYKKMSISDFIIYYLNYTSLGYYIQSFERGTERNANIDLLLEYAKTYESTSYASIFNFVKFVQKQEDNKSSDISAAVASKDDNFVTFMTIHKSKGLEFKVVFLSHTSKRFNKMDQRGKTVFDKGFAFKYKDISNVVYVPFRHHNICNAIDKSNFAEELRVLYVALTRAEERLIITCGEKDLEKSFENWQQLLKDFENKDFSKVDRYIDLIAPLTMGGDNFKKIVNIHECFSVGKAYDVEEEQPLEYDILDYFFEYKHKNQNIIPVDISVTNLIYLEENLGETSNAHKNLVLNKLDFKDKNEIIVGANYGTLIHNILCVIPFNKMYTLEDLQSLLIGYEQKNIINKAEHEVILKNVDKLLDFFESDMYLDILKAEKVYKEKPFAAYVEVDNFDEKLIVRGIIDLMYILNDEIYIVDYKTDYDKEKLIEKYKRQLELYKEFVEKKFKKTVKSTKVYFITHNETLEV
ncbi:MAG: UvrD-helicase domain-containing protein [Lachnospirales bacterium]